MKLRVNPHLLKTLSNSQLIKCSYQIYKKQHIALKMELNGTVIFYESNGQFIIQRYHLMFQR
jgi:hypothetical protein